MSDTTAPWAETAAAGIEARANSAKKEPTPTPSDGVDMNHPARADVAVADAEQGRVGWDQTRRTYALCGFAMSSRDMIPVADTGTEIWGMNQLYRHIGRADRWFDIHENWDEEVVEGTDHEGWIRDCGIPVYMTRTHRQLPTSVRYPVERMADKFGDYFTSTVPFMLAIAIDEIDQRVQAELLDGAYETPSDVLAAREALYGTYTIAIYGIDLIVGEEYFHQKPCAEYWIGIASARGIKVRIPSPSALCKQMYRYGYEREPRGLIRESDLAERLKRATAERDELLRGLYLHDGYLQAIDDLGRTFTARARGVGD